MHGLEQIKAMNKDPDKHARSEMSDGQERRNDAPPSNYWSETPGGDRDFDKALAAALPVIAAYRPAVDMATAQLNPKTLERLNAKPLIYFDAVKMVLTLHQLADEANNRWTMLRMKLRALQTAQSDAEVRQASAELTEAMRQIVSGDRDIAVRMHVEELANLIDQAAPVPHGYTPRMGLAHAMAPLRKIVNTIRECWAQADG